MSCSPAYRSNGFQQSSGGGARPHIGKTTVGRILKEQPANAHIGIACQTTLLIVCILHTIQAGSSLMNIIATRTIREYQKDFPDAATALDAWLEVVSKAHWENLNEVSQTYASADQVGSCLVFNIRGNNYRLICGVSYANEWVNGTLFIKHFLTHAEYDKEAWKRDCQR